MKKIPILILALLMLAVIPSGVPGSRAEDKLESMVYVPGNWVWVRDIEVSFYVDPLGNLAQQPPTGWFATKNGKPDPYAPWLPSKGGLSTERSEPPAVAEVMYVPYRSGNIGPYGIRLEPTGHWKWDYHCPPEGCG